MNILSIFVRLRSLIRYNMTREQLNEAHALLNDAIAIVQDPRVSRSRF